jgi:hypothetical protein
LRIRELKDFARHESPATGGAIGAFLGELLPTSSTMSAIWLKASGLKERRDVPSLAMKNLLAQGLNPMVWRLVPA